MNAKINGNGTNIWEDGSEWNGTFEKGKLHRKCIVLFSKGKI